MCKCFFLCVPVGALFMFLVEFAFRTLSSLVQLDHLLHTYYPIEIDSSRSVEEKLPLMVEWWVSLTRPLRALSCLNLFCKKKKSAAFVPHRWTKAHDLLVEQKIRKDLLAEAVSESEVMLRWVQPEHWWDYFGGVFEFRAAAFAGRASSSSSTTCMSTASLCSSSPLG